MADAFDRWYERASVRSKPRRVLDHQGCPDLCYFDPELVPACSHPLVAGLGPAATRLLMVRHLYRYLEFTTVLEHDAVNKVARCIGSGNSGIPLPEEMLLDALRLYCDEGFHALICADLRDQAEFATSIPRDAIYSECSFTWLTSARALVATEMRPLFDMLFVVVSETMISASLTVVARSERVMGAVRDVARDHAADEAVHQAYFVRFFELFWPSLSSTQRATLGPLLPTFILGFLAPDLNALERDLTLAGLGWCSAQRVMEEGYSARKTVADARRAARVTLSLFRRMGVFADSRTADAFARADLTGEET